MLYYLQNVGIGFSGNFPYWWKKGGSGYTYDLNNAEQMTSEEASKIMRSTKGTHTWEIWGVEYIDSLANLQPRIVDMQTVRKHGALV